MTNTLGPTWQFHDALCNGRVARSVFWYEKGNMLMVPRIDKHMLIEVIVVEQTNKKLIVDVYMVGAEEDGISSRSEYSDRDFVGKYHVRHTLQVDESGNSTHEEQMAEIRPWMHQIQTADDFVANPFNKEAHHLMTEPPIYEGNNLWVSATNTVFVRYDEVRWLPVQGSHTFFKLYKSTLPEHIINEYDRYVLSQELMNA